MTPRPLVALAGNQNTGKTTLFNALTGLSAKVGNYPGVTVTRRVGPTRLGAEKLAADVLDVPGTYSLVARTGEEEIAIKAMLGLAGERRPDLAVLCVDATQLLRGLYLVLQVQELGLPVVVALTMMDEARDAACDPGALASLLGCRVVAVDARRRRGLDALGEAVTAELKASGAAGGRAALRFTPSAPVARALDRVKAALPADWPQTDATALWALQSVGDGDELTDVPIEVRRAVAEALPTPQEAMALDDEVVGARYRFLDERVGPLLKKRADRSRTERFDRVLLHRVWGFPVFLLTMFVVFQALFAWADPPIAFIEGAFNAMAGAVERAMPPGVLSDFLTGGLIAGVGSVLVFLPQILLLFFFVGLLEDSGYLARVAHLMDRLMATMNLNGRAFVPLLSGFACAVPAVVSTRTMERKRDRLLTMLVVPLMTCSARLPVYTLVIGALFPARRVLGVFPVQGLLMVAMYVLGAGTALLAAFVMSRTIKPLRATRLPLVIELPPYRVPRLRDVARLMVERSTHFLRDAGGVILIATVALWALLAFPRQPEVTVAGRDGRAADAEALRATASGERMRASYGGRLGHAIEPVIAPLGFDWKIGVGLLGAFAAREVFVSTMGVVYSVADADEESVTLRERIRAERRPDGRLVYTPLVGLSLLVFFALACQCTSTLAVVYRESGSWRWPAFLFVYMGALAWTASFAVYQGGRLLGFS